MSQIQFETVPLSVLRPYARNARHHSRKQVKAIAAGMAEFGVTNPPLIDEVGEIIAGHGRLEAAQQLGLSTIPVIRISGLSEVQKRALRLADNKLALDSVWNVELLSAELADLTLTDFDITLTGFEAIEVDKLTTPAIGLSEVDRPLPDPPQNPISRSADLWKLGDHSLIVGNALDPSAYRTLLGSKLVDMVMTDPPYNVRIAGHVSGNGRVKHDEFAMASGEMDDAQFGAFLEEVIRLVRMSSRDGSLHYFCSDWRMISVLTRVGAQQFSQLMNIAVWVKPNAGMGSFYRSQHEMVAIFKHGQGSHINNIQLGRMGRHRSNVWQYPGGSGFSKMRDKDLKDHPTVKPLGLVADAIRDATKPGDLVLDPFGGAGTTLIAAEITKRRAALMEIEPKYADVTLRRFHEHTGIEPVLLPECIPFREVRAQRLVASKETAE